MSVAQILRRVLGQQVLELGLLPLAAHGQDAIDEAVALHHREPLLAYEVGLDARARLLHYHVLEVPRGRVAAARVVVPDANELECAQVALVTIKIASLDLIVLKKEEEEEEAYLGLEMMKVSQEPRSNTRLFLSCKWNI